MANKILLAVDESQNSEKAIKYVIENMKNDSVITILSILPDATAACGLDSRSLTPLFKENRLAFCAIEDTKKEKVQKLMKEAREKMVKAGFAPGNVNVRIRKKKKGIARDILKEAQQGHYDTVIMGRRGLTGVKEFLMGSISSKVLHLASGMSVLVAD